MKFIHFLFEPKSTNRDEAFREHMIRIIVIVAVGFFMLLSVMTLLDVGFSTEWAIWHGLIYSISALIFCVIQFEKVDLAARILALGMVLIVIDDTSAY
jgi:multidrug transporter EmrE-like cation transporter